MAEGHCASLEQAPQTCVVPLQIGVVPEQSALLRQLTQVPLPVKQNGVVPVQALALVAEHWPQAPDDWQAGVAPPHSPSPLQARQAWVAVLHTGAVPLHWAFDTQGTHVPVAV